MSSDDKISGATPLKTVGFAESERATLRARGLTVIGDLRRHGVDGLAALGIHGFLLERCERALASPQGSPDVPVEERDPGIQGMPSIPVPVPTEEPLPKGKRRRPKTGPRPLISVVCDDGHITPDRKQGPHLYKPCPTCGGLVRRTKETPPG